MDMAHLSKCLCYVNSSHLLTYLLPVTALHGFWGSDRFVYDKGLRLYFVHERVQDSIFILEEEYL